MSLVDMELPRNNVVAAFVPSTYSLLKASAKRMKCHEGGKEQRKKSWKEKEMEMVEEKGELERGNDLSGDGELNDRHGFLVSVEDVDHTRQDLLLFRSRRERNGIHQGKVLSA